MKRRRRRRRRRSEVEKETKREKSRLAEGARDHASTVQLAEIISIQRIMNLIFSGEEEQFNYCKKENRLQHTYRQSSGEPDEQQG